MSARRGVLVGVDGSAPAKVAVDWAAREAASRNVPLKIVYVLTPAMMMTWPELSMPPDYTRWQEQQGRDILDDAVVVAREAAGLDLAVDTDMPLGPTLTTMIDLTKEADLVVVGSRGRGAVARRLLGSVSSGLVRHAHCPVAVIHDEDIDAPTPAQAPVVVGIDGSRASEVATEIAFDFASRRGADLVAVHAISDSDLIEMPRADYAQLEENAKAILSERLAGYSERYPDVQVRRVVEWARPANMLVRESEGAQLVVVGSHGRGGFAGMLLGSVASSVAQAVKTPVIVARQG